MEPYKIIIIGPKHVNKIELAQTLVSINDDLEIAFEKVYSVINDFLKK